MSQSLTRHLHTSPVNAPTLFCRICSKISKLQLRNSTYSNPTPTVASPKKLGISIFLFFSQFFRKMSGFHPPCLRQDLGELQTATQQGQKPETDDLLGNVQGEIQDIPFASKKKKTCFFLVEGNCAFLYTPEV